MQIQIPQELVPAVLDRCAMYDPNLVGRAVAEVQGEVLQARLAELESEAEPEAPPDEE